MRILFIGDIVGKPGRKAVSQILSDIVCRHEIELVIANCENAAGGFGVTRDIIEELYRNNINVLTSGNHIWDKKEVGEFIQDYETLLRPANYPEGVPGRGSVLVRSFLGNTIGVINLMGRVFMQPLDCPFRVAEREIEKLRGKTSIIIVDIHAEATSEKQAIGWFLDGRVSAVLGTHTHVQTADERILPCGTAYITDAGMTGSFDSVIGIKKDIILKRFLTGIPNKFDAATRDRGFQGVIVDIEESGKSVGIERVSVQLES